MSLSNDIFNDVKMHLASLLAVEPDGIDDEDNLFQLGVDSMQMMTLLNELKSKNIHIRLRELYQQPSLTGLKNLIGSTASTKEQTTVSNDKGIQVQPSESLPTMMSGQAFPLTPVQHAYFVGRSSEQALGGVGCHLYQEFDGQGLDSQHLDRAIVKLIQRHPMLNVTFSEDGKQRWQPEVLWRGVTHHDFSQHSAAQQQERLLALRDLISHRVLAVESGQCFDIQMVALSGGRHRLIVDIDLLVMDAASFSLFFSELSALLKGEILPPAIENYDFRSYLAQAEKEQKQAKAIAEQYWQTKIDTLPPAPALPLATEPNRKIKPIFTRQRQAYSEAQWEQLKQLAAEHQVTPTMVLATVFAAILSRWSGQQKLLLNLTLFDCLPLHQNIERMLADFTNILLLDAQIDQDSLINSIQALQAEFADVYEHRSVSGVEVLRQLRKQDSHPYGAPVVFTSNLGRSLYGDATEDVLGSLGWGISQTPQVWIDFVAYEHRNQLYVQWDSNKTLFPEGLLDVMFTAFNDLLGTLVDNGQAWLDPIPTSLPVSQQAVRQKLNYESSLPVPNGLLHEQILTQAQTSPNAIALIDGDHCLTYSALLAKAEHLAAALIAQDLQVGERVAISMDKGAGQIIAVLGILLAGGVYVPVPANQPDARRQQIYRSADIRQVIVCDESRQNYSWPAGVNYFSWQQLPNQAISSGAVSRRRRLADEEAYIIYTSGSTGVPKGVVISHRGALNTCLDINDRHQVSASDRVLGLSALHFDLSVYDIFGVLSAGGTLVIPQESQRRDPNAWCQLIEQHSITLWNTVPALFDMLLTFAEGLENSSPALLRTVMLSGDWIGLTLPKRYHQFNPMGVLSAMGGATEASIWSNEYIVADVDSQWRSIPYGFALRNQRYRVVDGMGRDCPDWVPGELWIGGVGVAMGYCNNPEQTQAQFVEERGERWYRTGDMGCYWPDGTLEFLGRKDNQVKVGGYRIELAEVDAGIQRVPGVKDGVALAVGERDKQLVSFIVLESAEVEDSTQLYQLQPANTLLPKNYATLFNTFDPIDNTHNDAVTHSALRHFLVAHFNHMGLSLDSEPESLARSHGISEQYRPLLCRWINFIKQTADDSNASVQQDAKALVEQWSGQHQIIHEIMCGAQRAEVLLDTPLAPEQLLYREADNFADQKALIEVIKSLSDTLKRPVKVVEYGCRSGLHGERLVALLSAEQMQYVGLEHSQTLVQQAKKRLSAWHYATVEKVQPDVLARWRYQADIVLLNNRLHVAESPANALAEAVTMAAPGALVMVLEVASKSPLTLISADMLMPETIESGSEPTVRSQQQWLALFNDCQLRLDHQWCSANHLAFVLRQQPSVCLPDHDAVLNALQQELPNYMVPRRLIFLDSLPLTPNGKIDRRSLLAHINESSAQSGSLGSPEQATDSQFSSIEEQMLASVWQQLLDIENLTRDSDFFQLGGDSLAATRCIGALKDQGYIGDLAQLFAQPCLSQFATTLTKQAASTADAVEFVVDIDNRYQPFSLTDVQQAYWIGRQPGFALSGVGAHFFIEFHVDELDLERFDQVWNRLIARHEMLRVVVRKHQQQILSTVPRFSTRVYSVDSLEGDTANRIREQQSHQVLDPACWPVFDVQALHDPQDRFRLLISLDNMLLDGLSMQILLNELQVLYHNMDAALPELGVSFRDYVLHSQRTVNEEQQPQRIAKDYWQQQLATLPPAPALPLQQSPQTVQQPTFIRMAGQLDVEHWQALKQLAQRHHITPSTLLIGAYAAVLSQWSQQAALTINLTLFDRQSVHENINHILGDFTSLLLVPWRTAGSWQESIKKLQQKTVEGLQHSQVSAVWVMRELAQRQQQADAAMPVVFTSALGTGSRDFLSNRSWLKPVGGISQTPQVWLDHQVYEADCELRFNWDAVEALLPKALLAQMFQDYCALLQTLAETESAWSKPITELIPPVMNRPEAIGFFNPESDDSNCVPVVEPLSPTTSNTVDQRNLARDIEHHFRTVTTLNIQPTQNFFDAGATSLHLVQLHIALQKLDFPHLQVTDVFAYPSPLALANYLTSIDMANDSQLTNSGVGKDSQQIEGDAQSGERLSRAHRQIRRQRRQKTS